MEPIFSDKDVRNVLKMYELRSSHRYENEVEHHRNKSGDETLYYKLAKAVRDAVEDKFHALAEEEYTRRQEEGMKHIREIGRLMVEARRED